MSDARGDGTKNLKKWVDKNIKRREKKQTPDVNKSLEHMIKIRIFVFKTKRGEHGLIFLLLSRILSEKEKGERNTRQQTEIIIINLEEKKKESQRRSWQNKLKE